MRRSPRSSGDSHYSGTAKRRIALRPAAGLRTSPPVALVLPIEEDQNPEPPADEVANPEKLEIVISNSESPVALVANSNSDKDEVVIDPEISEQNGDTLPDAPLSDVEMVPIDGVPVMMISTDVPVVTSPDNPANESPKADDALIHIIGEEHVIVTSPPSAAAEVGHIAVVEGESPAPGTPAGVMEADSVSSAETGQSVNETSPKKAMSKETSPTSTLSPKSEHILKSVSNENDNPPALSPSLEDEVPNDKSWAFDLPLYRGTRNLKKMRDIWVETIDSGPPTQSFVNELKRFLLSVTDNMCGRGCFLFAVCDLLIVLWQ